MSNACAIDIVKPTDSKHTATLIFLHGSGASGDHMKKWIRIIARSFTFPHIKIVYPTAPIQGYTPAGGIETNVWFDRAAVAPDVPEMLESIDAMKDEILELIRQETDQGIPTNRIILGGFSMGGAMALHVAYRWERNIAGVFVVGSFLNDNSIVYEAIKQPPGNLPTLLQIHGDKDEIVEMPWAQSTMKNLKSLGVKGEFQVIGGVGHTLNKPIMLILKDWILKLLPDVD